MNSQADNIPDQCKAMREQLRNAGVAMGTFWETARIRQSTFHRWEKDGVAPRTDTWDRAREAVSQLVGANDVGGPVEPSSPGATPPG